MTEPNDEEAAGHRMEDDGSSEDSEANEDSKSVTSFKSRGSTTVHPCPYANCSKYFSRPSRLNVHLLSHSGQRPLKCSVEGCGKTYTRAAHLKRHVHFSHGGDESKKSCNDEPRFKCDKCPSDFANKYSLKKHANVAHSPIDGERKRYGCEECGKTFHKHHLLSTHIESVHHGEQFSLHCKDCEAKFQFSSQLNLHMKKHDKEKKLYHCASCHQEFDKWTLLRKHVSRVHVEEKRNLCEVCGLQCASKANLRNHRDTHKDSRKVFHCPHKPCTRYYYFERNLVNHVKGYHEDGRLPCQEPDCGTRLSSRKKLLLHMASIHGSSGRKVRRKTATQRCDKGKPKKSMAAELSGIIRQDLDLDSERLLLSNKETTLNPNDLAEEVLQNPVIKDIVPEVVERPERVLEREDLLSPSSGRSFGSASGEPVFTLPFSNRTRRMARQGLPVEEVAEKERSAEARGQIPADWAPAPRSQLLHSEEQEKNIIPADPKRKDGARRKPVDLSKFIVSVVQEVK